MKRIAIPTVFLAAIFLSACGTEATVETEKIQMQVSDGYIQYYNGSDWENLISVEELRGEKGDQGADGKDGKDGIDGKDGKTGETGAQGMTGASGRDGEDGKDGVDGKDGMNTTATGICNHRYKRKSQTSEEIEKYDIYRALWRTTETYQCDICGNEMILYNDWIRTTPDWELPSTPTPTPYSTPTPTLPTSMTPTPVPEQATPKPEHPALTPIPDQPVLTPTPTSETLP